MVDTFVLGQFDHKLFSLSDSEAVSDSGGERFAFSVLNVANIETSQMFFNINDLSDSSDVVSLCNVDGVANIKVSVINDFVGVQIVLDGVINVVFGVGESDGSGIMGNNVRDFIRSDGFLGDFQ